MGWSSYEELESIIEKGHYYNNEEDNGYMLSASYNPVTQDLKVITENRSYTEFLPSQENLQIQK